MAKRQTFVVGALGVLVGMVVGASSSQNAQTVSYSGHDPNSEAVQTQDDLHRAAGYIRFRFNDGTVGDNGGVATRMTPPRQLSRAERMVRNFRQRMLGSAPTVNVRGAELPNRRVPECAEYTRDRYTRCLESLINGEEFQPNYFETDYQE